jgi:hypothetical protein
VPGIEALLRRIVPIYRFNSSFSAIQVLRPLAAAAARQAAPAARRDLDGRGPKKALRTAGQSGENINGSRKCFTFSPGIRSKKTCDGGVLNITRSMKTLRIFCSE